MQALMMATQHNPKIREKGYLQWLIDGLISAGFLRVDKLRQPHGTIRAQIWRSIWRGVCPAKGCNGSILADEQWPFFFCPACYNEGNDYRPYYLDFGDMERLELVLRKRIHPGTRNMLAGETVGDLIEENKQHGEW